MNFLSKLRTLGSVSELRIQRVGATEEGYAGADEGAGADGDKTGI